MRIGGKLPAHGPVDLNLPRCIVQMIIAANDMGDAHIMVIHHDGEHINRAAIGTQQNHVIKLIVANDDIALHLVHDDRLPLARRFEPHHIGRVRVIGLCDIAPGGAKQGRAFLRLRRFSEGGDFLLCGKALIGVPSYQHFLCHLCMARRIGRLTDGHPIEVKPKPCQTSVNRLCGGLG